MTRLLKTLVPAVALALVAGCGGGSDGGSRNGIEKLSADKALAKVKSDVATVKSVHAVGRIDENGQQLSLDVHVARDRGIGTLGLGSGQLEVRLVDGTAYVRGDEAAYTAFGASSAQVKLIANKWLKGSSSSGDLSNFSGFLDLGKLFDSLLTPDGKVETGKTTTLHGQPAFTLVDSGAGGTLYIAETGKALPLRIEKTGTGGGQVDFTDYDDPVSVSAPSGAVDLSQLGQ